MVQQDLGVHKTDGISLAHLAIRSTIVTFPAGEPMSKHIIRVVAAVIEREGKILIGQRKRDDTHPLKWEFPGGKVERGERPQGALARELKEELGIRAQIGRELLRRQHIYSERACILLIFFSVTDFTGTPQNLAFEQITWETPSRLPEYDFLEGDLEFVQRLASGHYPAESAGA